MDPILRTITADEDTQVHYMLYTITWFLCAFSLVVDRDLLKDTHTRMVWNPRQQTCFSFFMPPKSFNKPFQFLLYILYVCVNCIYIIYKLYTCIQILYIYIQKMSQRVKNNTPIYFVSYFVVLYTLWHDLWSITVHTSGKILSFYLSTVYIYTVLYSGVLKNWVMDKNILS